MNRVSGSIGLVAMTALVMAGSANFAAAQRINDNGSSSKPTANGGNRVIKSQKPAPLTPATTHTFLPTVTATWNSTANWDTGMIPNGIDEAVIFNTPTAAQIVTIDGGAAKTVGSFTLTNDSAFVFTLSNGAAGSSLVFDVTSGNASLTINGTGNVVNVFGTSGTNLTIALNDTLDITINNTATTSVTGALQIQGAMSGMGGIIKDGAGRVSFATTPKTYTGSTIINAGMLRISVAGEPNATSSATVNSGGQLLLGTTASGAFQLGASSAVLLTLNGDGPTAGSGALASNAGSGTGTLSNVINLATNSTVNTATALALSGAISGPGRLTKTGSGSAAQNTLTLSATNSYAGGTTVNSGTLIAAANGALGTGNVDLAASGVNLTLQGAFNNFISDNATLSVVTGATVSLNQTGGSDTISGLVLGGAVQSDPGTYGNTASGAMHTFDTFFNGTGTLTLIPEPSTWAMTIMGAGLLLGVQRFRRKT